MLNCNYPNCKKHKTCNLKNPTTPLTTEIRYWLKQLKQSQKRLQEYDNVVKDITIYHKYSIPINIYGHIEYAPKVNTFGVFIRRPEHVYYGWNLNKLEKKVEELTEKIRSLRLKELEMMR
jgi:hypothetical protein